MINRKWQLTQRDYRVPSYCVTGERAMRRIPTRTVMIMMSDFCTDNGAQVTSHCMNETGTYCGPSDNTTLDRTLIEPGTCNWMLQFKWPFVCTRRKNTIKPKTPKKLSIGKKNLMSHKWFLMSHEISFTKMLT